MKISILKQYVKDDMQVTEYTRDEVTVSHTVETPILKESVKPTEPQATIEEQILAETQYQTALLEMQMLGGM